MESTSSGDVRHGLIWNSPLTFQNSHQELPGTIVYLYTTLEFAINATYTNINNNSSSPTQSSQYNFEGWNPISSERLDACKIIHNYITEIA